MAIFDEIKVGLEQAIAYNDGKIKARKITRAISPLASFTPNEIKQIRIQTGMTQVLFAQYMGVSVKTVEAWECGRNQPDGAARRLLAITRDNPMFPTESGIVQG